MDARMDEGGGSAAVGGALAEGLSGRADLFSSAASQDERTRQLRLILDERLGLAVPIAQAASLDTIQWLQRLIAFPLSFQEFGKKVESLDSREKCGLVWPSDSLAYRCRTCGISPCMSICAACFRAGDHTGHDFNMFKSQAGGACDCGDLDVMKAVGFCSSHGKARAPKDAAPPALSAAAAAALPKVLARILHHLRLKSIRNERGPRSEAYFREALEPVLPLLEQVKGLVSLGVVFHRLIHDLLTDKPMYAALSQEDPRANSRYQDEVKSLRSICDEEESEALDVDLNGELIHSTLLEELCFWLVAMDFPDPLVFLLLSLLPLDEYRTALARAFAAHYSRSARVVTEQRGDDDVLSSRVVHISVQLVSSEDCTRRMMEEGFLRVLIGSLHAALKSCRVERQMHSGSHLTLDCERAKVIRAHFYYSIVSDLHNVLVHPSVAIAFARDARLVAHWSSVLLILQGMNPTCRELDAHVQFESRAFSAAYTAEIEISAATLSAVLPNLGGPGTIRPLFESVAEKLGAWLAGIGATGPADGMPALQLIWHLPLHRWWSALVLAAWKSGEALDLGGEESLRRVFLHPLQLQVGRAEIGQGLWVRNGVEPRHQAIIYAQAHFARYFADPDLALLQIVGSGVDPEWLVLSVLERFHLVRWLSFSPWAHPAPYLRPEWEMGLLEAGLRLLAGLVALRHPAGLGEAGAMRAELGAVLATGDAAYSALLDAMPKSDRAETIDSGLLSEILGDVADYVETGPEESVVGSSQGRYRPAPKLWDEAFDPLLALFRNTHFPSFHSAILRLQDYAKKTGKIGPKERAWPPYRIPEDGTMIENMRPLGNILRSRALLSLIYTVLLRASEGAKTKKAASEGAVQLCVYLLELALWLPDDSGNLDASVGDCCGQPTVIDLHFLIWFPGRALHRNLAHRIQGVLAFDAIPAQSLHPQGSFDSPVMPELSRLNARKGRADEERRVARKPGIPYIDSLDSPTGEAPETSASRQFWDWYWAALPPAVRRLYIAHVHKPSLTLGGDWEALQAAESPSQSLVISETGPGAVALPGEPEPIVQVASEEEEDDMHTDQWEDEDDWAPAALPAPPERPHIAPASPAPKALPSPACYPSSFGGNSIISLLIRLHGRYTTTPYAVSEVAPSRQRERIGTGALHIGAVLDAAAWASPECRDEVQRCLTELREEEAKKASEAEASAKPAASTKEEKRAAAKAMQARLMAQMAKQQASVLSKYEWLNEEVDDTEDVTPANADAEEEPSIHCVICNCSSKASDLGNPIGLVALAEATSVLGASLGAGCEPGALLALHGDSGEVVRPMPATRSRGEVAQARLATLAQLFQPASVLRASSAGWDGGVGVRSCGHHVHAACHTSYVTVLRNDVHASHALHLERGEFNCPLCRQLANIFMPILPKKKWSDKTSPHTTQKATAAASSENLGRWSVTEWMEGGTALGAAVRKFVDRLSRCSYPKFNRPLSPTETPEDEWFFIRSIVRTNIELQAFTSVAFALALLGTASVGMGGGVGVMGGSYTFPAGTFLAFTGNWVSLDTASTAPPGLARNAFYGSIGGFGSGCLMVVLGLVSLGVGCAAETDAALCVLHVFTLLRQLLGFVGGGFACRWAYNHVQVDVGGSGVFLVVWGWVAGGALLITAAIIEVIASFSLVCCCSHQPDLPPLPPPSPTPVDTHVIIIHKEEHIEDPPAPPEQPQKSSGTDVNSSSVNVSDMDNMAPPAQRPTPTAPPRRKSVTFSDTANSNTPSLHSGRQSHHRMQKQPQPIHTPSP